MTITSARFVIGAAEWEQMPRDNKPEVAFLGRSNVGKSSLINYLVGRKALARTSNTPGKTRRLNFYLVNERFYFVDLPGLGFAKVGKKERLQWAWLIEEYIEAREQLRLLVHLIDARHDPTAYDRTIMSAMRGLELLYVVALTKSDKLSRTGREKSLIITKKTLLEHGLEAPVIVTSAEKKQGREDLLEWIGHVSDAFG